MVKSAARAEAGEGGLEGEITSPMDEPAGEGMVEEGYLADNPPADAPGSRQTAAGAGGWPRVALVIAVAVVLGVSASHILTRTRHSKQLVEVWRDGAASSREAAAAGQHQRYYQQEESMQAALQEAKQAADEAIQEQETSFHEELERQGALAEEIRLSNIQPPPPPAPPTPPLMSRADWEAQLKAEAAEELLQLRREKAVARKEGELRQGDWYWKASRAFQTPLLVQPKVPQCFRNATDRRDDFWAPLQTRLTTTKHPLPIYGFDAPEKATALCFAPRSPKARHKYKVYNCPSWPQRIKERWMGQSCTLRPLYEEMLLYLLRGHRVWFFGDQNLHSVLSTIRCTMAKHIKGHSPLPAGRLTGVKPEVHRLGLAGETELIYTYVGPYKLTVEKDDIPSHQVEGLGADLRAKYGLDAMVQFDQHTSGDDLVRLHELADAIQENMDHFRPSDVLVANIGNDHRDPRTLQASLMKFLRLYEDNAERLPVIVWQESTAQHHQGFKGGDMLSERTAEHGEDPTGRLVETITCGKLPGRQLQDANWRNQLSNRLIEAAGIPILRIWQASTEFNNQYTPRCHSGHCERFGPCRFYCLPGAMPTYIAETLTTLLDSDPLQEVLNARANKTVPWWQWQPEALAP